MRLIRSAVFCLFTSLPLWLSAHLATLPFGQTFEGNYFAVSSNVELSGVVHGDAYLMGSQIFVDGQVQGDLLVIGGNVDISGEVTGNVRLVGGQVSITGKVGRNVTLLAGNVLLSPAAKINGTLVCAAGNVDLASAIHGNVSLAASHARISSAIGANLDAYVGEIRFTSKAKVDGNVEYKSDNVAIVDQGAQIKGELTHRASLVHGLLQGKWIHAFLIGSKVAAALMNFLYTFVIGWIILRVFPRRLEGALQALQKTPWKSFAFGLMVLVLLPLMSLILLMTVLGAPFALTLIALNIIGFYTAKIFCIFWASNHLFTRIGLKANRLSTYFLGVVLYFLLTPIPFFGFLLSWVAMIFGMGAGLLAQPKSHLFSFGLKHKKA
jgi:cytoskeletal protein CcmA (bactofilin family)